MNAGGKYGDLGTFVQTVTVMDSEGTIFQRTRDDLERTRKRESLESSRRGVVKELESTGSDLRRRSLEAALKHLDEELAKL